MTVFVTEDLLAAVDFFHADPAPRFNADDIDEMREMGVSNDEIEALLAEEPEEEIYEVYPENWPAVSLYLSAYGQFVISDGKIHGFDLNAVDIDIRRSNREVTPETWEKFKFMARQTVNLLNQRN
ncbi:MAG: DUF1799 domain-containing protein [Pseudohongiella nitratireducens]|nr:DUF1799 domain-containing protein [Pseudohongiella nitratireducens]MDF1622524.1 DUF1799 domain-containing protein [Pseudohongiella nitratireducens]